MTRTQSLEIASHQLRFQSLFNEGRGLAFPCDHQGNVDLDTLGPQAKKNYFFARAMVGKEYATPSVLTGDSH